MILLLKFPGFDHRALFQVAFCDPLLVCLFFLPFLYFSALWEAVGSSYISLFWSSSQPFLQGAQLPLTGEWNGSSKFIRVGVVCLHLSVDPTYRLEVQWLSGHKTHLWSTISTCFVKLNIKLWYCRFWVKGHHLLVENAAPT